MQKINLHKYSRMIYYILFLLILVLSTNDLFESNITLYSDDVIFLIIFMISFILVNKYSIKLKNTSLNFNDFLIIILYIKFGISISITLLFICYLIILSIDYKDSKKQSFLTENIFIFNTVLVILSVYFTHLSSTFIDSIYYIRHYEIISGIVFSIVFLIFNYILFCLDLSFEKNKLILITLQDGLYYILLNFLLCTVMSVFSLSLYNLYGYLPMVIITVFIIFISFALNNLNNIKSKNNNLMSILQYSTYVISKLDFKVKLNHSIQVIEGIIPFIYCGIYLFRENYHSLYPICYKNNFLIDFKDTKFHLDKEDKFLREIYNGNVVFEENSSFKNIINLVNVSYSDIKYVLAVPIKNSDFTVGFILLCLSRHKELEDEKELLFTLGRHIGMVHFHINDIIKNNIINYKNYDGLTRYIDNNIKNKIFFTLAMIEISNSEDIIKKYNSDFYEAFKTYLQKFISQVLSPMDIILCFEKENIYIAFNLLDSKNVHDKLKEIEQLLMDFKFKNLNITPKISYSTCEYPMDGISSDEVLSIIYRNLQNKKTPKA